MIIHFSRFFPGCVPSANNKNPPVYTKNSAKTIISPLAFSRCCVILTKESKRENEFRRTEHEVI